MGIAYKGGGGIVGLKIYAIRDLWPRCRIKYTNVTFRRPLHCLLIYSAGGGDDAYHHQWAGHELAFPTLDKSAHLAVSLTTCFCFEPQLGILVASKGVFAISRWCTPFESGSSS